MSTKALRDAITAFGRARDVYDGPGMMGGSAMSAAAYDAAAKTLHQAATPEALLEILNENVRLQRDLYEAQVHVRGWAEDFRSVFHRAAAAERALLEVTDRADRAEQAVARTQYMHRTKPEEALDRAAIRRVAEDNGFVHAADILRLLSDVEQAEQQRMDALVRVDAAERARDHALKRAEHAEAAYEAIQSAHQKKETPLAIESALVRMKLTACAVLVWACDSTPDVDSVERAVDALAAHAEKLSSALARVTPTTEERHTLIRVCDQWIPSHVRKDEQVLRAWLKRINDEG